MLPQSHLLVDMRDPRTTTIIPVQTFTFGSFSTKSKGLLIIYSGNPIWFWNSIVIWMVHWYFAVRFLEKHSGWGAIVRLEPMPPLFQRQGFCSLWLQIRSKKNHWIYYRIAQFWKFIWFFEYINNKQIVLPILHVRDLCLLPLCYFKSGTHSYFASQKTMLF